MIPFEKKRAYEKVMELAPPSKEKGTLLAIAAHANSDGTSAWPKIETIAKESGQSERTVQYHIRELENRGELLVEPGKKGPRSNRYSIPVCRLSTEEREAITGVGRNQLKLPLVLKQELSEIVINEGARLAPADGKDCRSGVQGLHPNPPMTHQGFKGSGAEVETALEIDPKMEGYLSGVTTKIRVQNMTLGTEKFLPAEIHTDNFNQEEWDSAMIETQRLVAESLAESDSKLWAELERQK